MELTRRDALVAVAVGTAGGATAEEVAERVDGRSLDEREDRVLRGLRAAATVVFPSVVEPTDDFLRSFVLGRASNAEGFVAACEAALDHLDEASRRRFGAAFADLEPDRREYVLVDAGVPQVTADPDGSSLERVRYYVVNELLFALFSSPTGGTLVGNENPPGYPGGREAYQEGPDGE